MAISGTGPDPPATQERTAVLAAPGEVTADRAAQLQLITGTELVGQIRGDLAVRESFDRQRERCVLRRRGDRVGALCLVAVLGGEADVDVLAGDLSRPAGHVEDQRLRAGGLDDDVFDGGEPPGDACRRHDQSPEYRCSFQGSP
jgi:hypothetical protein